MWNCYLSGKSGLKGAKIAKIPCRDPCLTGKSAEIVVRSRLRPQPDFIAELYWHRYWCRARPSQAIVGVVADRAAMRLFLHAAELHPAGGLGLINLRARCRCPCASRRTDGWVRLRPQVAPAIFAPFHDIDAKRVKRLYFHGLLIAPPFNPCRLLAWGNELLSKVDGAVKSCWPMACLYRSLRFGEEYLPVSALLVDKT